MLAALVILTCSSPGPCTPDAADFVVVQRRLELDVCAVIAAAVSGENRAAGTRTAAVCRLEAEKKD